MARGNWRESIDSLLAQTLIDCEIMLVIDNPHVTASEIAFSGPGSERISIIRNEVNRGLTWALNAAARRASGKYLIRHDDDDISLPQRAALLTEYLDRHLDVDIVCSYAIGQQELHGKKSSWLIRSPIGDAAIKDALSNYNCIVHPTVAFRTESFNAIGGYDTRFRFAQDYDLFLRAKKRGMIFECIQDPLLVRNYSDQSITVSKRRTQATYSFAAKLLHKADDAKYLEIARDLLKFFVLVSTPRWARKIRRQMGLGR